MAVVPRSSAPGDGAQITSPKVATNTVVGMVLGILCLFTIIVSYQMVAWPCKKKRDTTHRVPRNGQWPVITTLDSPSKAPHSFRTFLYPFKRAPYARQHKHTLASTEKTAFPRDRNSGATQALRKLRLTLRHRDTSAKQPTLQSDSTRKPTLRERRALRSLYLNTNLSSPRKRYTDTPSSISPSFKRMGRIFQFDSTPPETPSTSSPFLTPRTPRSRRHYKQLDESPYSDWSNEAVYHTERPADALISPWSPNEGEFPYYTPYSPGFKSFNDSPRTPPPLPSPLPAYIPEIPLRATGSNPPTPTRPTAPSLIRNAMTPPVSPIVASLSEAIDGEIGSWEVNRVREALAKAVEDSVFVISNDSDSEDGGAASDMDSVSIHTDEFVEPLQL